MGTPITIDFNGRPYGGTYELKNGLITVRGDGGGTKTTQLGSTPALTLAKTMLGEILREQEAGK